MVKSNTQKLLGSIIILLILIGVSFGEIQVAGASGESIKLMPLGDSITEGVTTGVTDPIGYRQKLYLDLTNAGFNIDFVGALSDGGTAVPSFDTDHEGHAGWHTGQIGHNVYGWLEDNPADIVLLHIGTNDVTYEDENATEVEGTLNFIDQYETDYSRHITVILARIILRNDTRNPQTIAYNNDVESMALERIANGDDIIIVDMENALTYPDDIADYVHPTPEGYEKMAVVWYDAILQALSPAHLVVRGLNNGISYRTYNRSWSDWKWLPGSTSDRPAAATLRHVITTNMTTWSNGFEEGDFSEWSQVVEDPGCSANVVTTDPRDGSYHASFSTTGDGSAFVRKSFEASPSSVHFKAYVQPKGRNAGIWAWVLSLGRDDLGIAAVLWDTNGNWSLSYRDGGAWYSADSSVAVTNDVWFLLELYHKSGSGDGEDKLWVNGNLEVSKTGLDNDDRGNPVYGVVGKILGSDDGEPVVYIDSVTLISNTTLTVTNSTPTLDVVVRGASGAGLYHGFVNLTDSSFSGWTVIPGQTPSAPALASDDSKLYLVVRGMDDRIYYNIWDGTWSGWTGIQSGSTSNSPTATILDGALHIVVQGYAAASLYHGSVNLTDGTFSGWTTVPGRTPSAPTLASDGSSLYLVVRGTDNQIYYNVWNGGWGSWTPISGSTTDSPTATILDGALHIVVQGYAATSLWHGYVNLADGVFSGWIWLTGQTPSAPTLAC